MTGTCANCGGVLNYEYYEVCHITGKLIAILYRFCSMKCLRKKMSAKRRNKK